MISIHDRQGGQLPVIRSKYTHMMIEDSIVWVAYLKTIKHDILKVWYDVHVGQPMPSPYTDEENYKKMVNAISRKRIDVVVETTKNILVVEIKPYGNMVALGQALTYTRLFKKEYTAKKTIKPAICCSQVDRDILDDIELYNIELMMPEMII